MRKSLRINEKVILNSLPGLVLAMACLVVVPNVYDGTFLKPAILYCGTALLLISSLAGAGAPLSLRLLNLPVVVYLAATLLSLVNAHDLLLGAERFVQVGCCAVFYLWMRTAAVQERDRIRITAMLVLLAVGLCAVAFLHYVLPDSSVAGYTARQLAGMSTFGNKAYFGGFLATLVPLAAAYAWQRWKNGGGIVMPAAAVAILLTALLQTGSRSSWIGAVAGCAIVLLMGMRTAKSRLAAVAALAGLLGIGLLAAPADLRQRIYQLFETGPQSTVERRTYFYAGAWRAFTDSPFLGHGAGNFTVFLPAYRSPDYWTVQSEDIVPHAHNEYLEVLSESGLAGFVGFALVLVAALASAGRRFRAASQSEQIFWAGMIAAIASCLIDNAFNMSLRTIPVELLFWMLLGMATEPRSEAPAARVRSIGGAVVCTLIFAAVLTLYVPRLERRYGAEKAYLQGLMARYSGDGDRARADFNEAVSLDPRHMEARFFLGANLTEGGKYREARVYLEHLIELRPYYPRARTLLAIGAAERGDSSGAMRLISEELNLETSPQAYYFGSHLAARLGNPELQYRYLVQGLEQNIRAGSSDYLLEALDDLPAACQSAGNDRECTSIIDRLAETFAGRPEIMQRLEEIRLGMRTG